MIIQDVITTTIIAFAPSPAPACGAARPVFSYPDDAAMTTVMYVMANDRRENACLSMREVFETRLILFSIGCPLSLHLTPDAFRRRSKNKTHTLVRCFAWRLYVLFRAFLPNDGPDDDRGKGGREGQHKLVSAMIPTSA